MYSRITVSSRPTVDTISPRPEVLTNEILLALSVDSRKVNRTLALDESHHFRYCILGWNRDHHVHVVRHQMTFLNPALLLFGEAPEYLAQVLAKAAVKRLAATLRYENHVLFALPLAVA